MRMLAVILALVCNYWDDTPCMQALRAHVEEITLSCHEGRAPGSEGEAEVAAYVASKLSDAGVDVISGKDGDVFGISREAQKDTLRSRNVIGWIPGYDAVLKKRYIVVGARMDNLGTDMITVDGENVHRIYSGANGNASGLAVMLELASRLVKESLTFRRSVIFVAFGASTSSFAGAWHFVNQSFAKDMPLVDCFVNLDIMGGTMDKVMAFTGGNADLNDMVRAVNASLPPLKPYLSAYEPYPSDQQVFYAAGIPSILFTTGRYSQHNTPRDTPDILNFDTMEREVEYLTVFMDKLVNAPAGVPSFDDNVEPEVKDDKSGTLVRGWSDCDYPPAFCNNRDPSYFLQKWVYPYLRYPDACVRDGIQGRVMVTFIIGADGKLRDVHVSRGIDPELDDEAVRVVSASPKWTPARHNGKKVDCSMTIPVEFRLQKKGKLKFVGSPQTN